MDKDIGEFEEADIGALRSRLEEMEQIAATLEARLARYQDALESIRATAGRALDG